MVSSLIAEAKCLRRLVAGEDAWAEFWGLYGNVIEYEVNRFFGADTGYLDDIYQELVMKLLDSDYKVICNHLDSKAASSFGSLVRRITRNMLIDIWRKHKRRPGLELLETAEHQVKPLPTSNNPATQYQQEQNLNDILLLATSNNQDSSTFKMLFLRFVDGESVNYIAKELGMREDTVRHRIDYNLKKLRKEHGDALAVASDD